MARIITRSLLALLVLYLLGRLFLGHSGFVRQYQIKHENMDLSQSLDSLQIVLESKKKERSRLLHDTLYIEQIARTHFGMSRPEEKVFQFVAQDSLRNDKTQPPTLPGASK